MAYIYLSGSIIFALIWIIFFILRKDLRKKLFYMSLFAAPLALTEILYVPLYWDPKFKMIPIFSDLFLEDILFCFFLGGVIAVIYQVIFKEKLFRFKKVNPFITLIALVIFMLYFFRLVKINIMQYSIICMLIGGIIIIIFLGKKVIKPMIVSAILITIVFVLFYSISAYYFPELPASYNTSDLLGILIFGIPIEEFLWFFSFSFYWVPIYEIWVGYGRKIKF